MSDGNYHYIDTMRMIITRLRLFYKKRKFIFISSDTPIGIF
jgi:hypothetical protein